MDTYSKTRRNNKNHKKNTSKTPMQKFGMYILVGWFNQTKRSCFADGVAYGMLY